MKKKNPKNELLKFHWTIHSLRNHFLVVNSQMPLSVKKSQGNILSWGYLKVHLPNCVIMLLPGAKENLSKKKHKKNLSSNRWPRGPQSLQNNISYYYYYYCPWFLPKMPHTLDTGIVWKPPLWAQLSSQRVRHKLPRQKSNHSPTISCEACEP